MSRICGKLDPGNRHRALNSNDDATLNTQSDTQASQGAEAIFPTPAWVGDANATERFYKTELPTWPTERIERERKQAHERSLLLDPAVPPRWLQNYVERLTAEIDKRTSTNGEDEAEWEPIVSLDSFNLPPFPVNALTAWLAQFAGEEAQATQTPPDLAALLELSVCAASIAKKFEVRVRPGWIEPVNIFTATSLPSGSRKSRVFGDVTAPLAEFEESEIKRLAPEVAEGRSRYKIAEAALQRAEQMAARTADRADRELAARLARDLAAMLLLQPPRLIADDCSPERLATLLRDHGGRMAVMSPEGDVFDLMAGKYSASGQPNLGVYLRAHAGDDLRVDRVGRPPDFVKAPALTLGLAVQPEVLRSLSQRPGFRGRGLLARILYGVPKSLLGERQVNAAPVSPATRAKYRANVLSLLGLPSATDSDGAPCAHILNLQPAAAGQLIDFERTVEKMFAPGGELEHMTDWGGKLVGAVARIAGILHVAEHVEGLSLLADSANIANSATIGLPTIENAIEIGDYLQLHARAAFAQMGTDPETSGAQYLVDWISRSQLDSFSKRDAFEKTKGKFKRVGPLTQALEVLEEHNYIRNQQRGDRSGPGRKPSPIYAVNPSVLSRYSQDSQIGAGA